MKKKKIKKLSKKLKKIERKIARLGIVLDDNSSMLASILDNNIDVNNNIEEIKFRISDPDITNAFLINPIVHDVMDAIVEYFKDGADDVSTDSDFIGETIKGKMNPPEGDDEDDEDEDEDEESVNKTLQYLILGPNNHKKVEDYKELHERIMKQLYPETLMAYLDSLGSSVISKEDKDNPEDDLKKEDDTNEKKENDEKKEES